MAASPSPSWAALPSTPTLLVEREGCALVVTLHRPATLNAFNGQMYHDLIAVLTSAASDDTVAAVILTGAGRYFSSGADLGEPAHPADNFAPFVRTLHHFPKPIIAAVNGPAVGIGMTTLLHCDFVVACASAWMSVPFTAVGVVPEAGSSHLLPRRVGRSAAMEMLLLGRRLTAQEALTYGLVSRVVATPEEVLPCARGLAASIAAVPMASVAVPLYKSMVTRHLADVADAVEGELTPLVARYDAGHPVLAVLMGRGGAKEHEASGAAVPCPPPPALAARL